MGRYITSDPIGLQGGLNTFGYVGGNPLVRFDRYGLFAGDLHSIITIDSLGGDTTFDSSTLGDLAQNADYLPGSQDPENSHMHGMSDGTTNESPAAAQRRFEDFINEQIATCTLAGLARALHAAQDSAARGHAGNQPWPGGRPSRSHMKGDFFPTDKEYNTAVQRSRNIIERYKKKCLCN